MVNPVHIGALLKVAMRRAKIGVVVEAALVVSEAQRFFDERFGASSGVVVRALKSNVLHIEAGSAPARTEVQLCKEALFFNLRQKFRKEIVRRIRFV